MLLTAVSAMTVVSLSGAQGKPPARVESCGPNDVVPWWPRQNNNLGSETLTAAERAAVEARLGAVEGLIRKSPYSTTRGFAVKPVFSIHEITNRTQLYPYGFVLNAMRWCDKFAPEAHLQLEINPNPQAWSEGDRPMLDEGGDGLYTERIRTPTLFGATATFGRFHEENTEGLFVLFTTDGMSPTVPVTREEYLRAMIFTLEGRNQEKVKSAAAIASKTPYERWLEEAPARKKRNEEVYAIVAKSNPAQAAKMRADMEKAELAEAEKLRKTDAYERAQLDKNIAALKAPGEKYRAQIAAMTPAERTSPAYLVGYDIVPAGTPNAHAIVRKNPAFYRAGRSPLEARAILVRMESAFKPYRPQQEQLYKQLDWAAIKKMVNP
jgi:hypothetical protein